MEIVEKADIVLWQIFEELMPYNAGDIILYFYVPEKGYIKDYKIPDSVNWKIRNSLQNINIYSYGDLAWASYTALSENCNLADEQVEILLDFIKCNSIIRIVPPAKEGIKFDKVKVDSFIRFLNHEGITSGIDIARSKEHIKRALSNLDIKKPFTEEFFYEYLGELSKFFPINLGIEAIIMHKVSISEPFGFDGDFFKNPEINRCLETQIKEIIAKLIENGKVIVKNNRLYLPRFSFNDIFYTLDPKEKEIIVKDMNLIRDECFSYKYHKDTGSKAGYDLIDKIREKYGKIHEDGYTEIYGKYGIHYWVFQYGFELTSLQMYYIEKTNRLALHYDSFYQDSSIPKQYRIRMKLEKVFESDLMDEYKKEDFKKLLNSAEKIFPNVEYRKLRADIDIFFMEKNDKYGLCDEADNLEAILDSEEDDE